MKTLLIAAALSTALFNVPVQAADETIMIELGFGFGTSGRVTKTKEQLANKFNNKFCFHRPSGTPIYGAIRYRYDDVEAHVGGWLVSSDRTRCDRDSYVAGIGYVFDTQTGSGEDSIDDYYASYTPGIAYAWGRNKDFNVQDNTNTNWRMKDNFQFYNRLAVGGGNESGVGEIAVIRYGNPVDDYERTGETFFTISAGVRDYDKDNTSDGDRGLTPPTDPDDGGFTIIITPGTETTPPSAPVTPPPTTPPVTTLPPLPQLP